MKTMLTTLVLGLLLVLQPAAQAPTHADVYRVLTNDVFSGLGVTLFGPGFGTLDMPLTRTFRLSLASAKDTDGLVRTLQEKLVVTSSATFETFVVEGRKQVPGVVARLATRVAPYSAFGSLQPTKQPMTDATTQTPDSLVLAFPRGGFVLRSRYTRGWLTGDHTVFFELLVGE